MSLEHVIIHVPNTPVNTDEVTSVVRRAVRADKQVSPQTQQLHERLLARLEPVHLGADIAGDNCIVISDYDELIGRMLQYISPILAEYYTLTINDEADLVWTYGDEDTTFTTVTSECEAPWASLRGIPRWIHQITDHAREMAELNIGQDPRDFLIIADNSLEEHYMQCFYNTAVGNYRLEMRLGDAQHHYWRDIADADSLIHELSQWIRRGDRSTEGWQKLDIT
ncbi:hypothetical protein CCICO_02495 [Corynebacterium ciconiae DSM 44920]|uniref:hypothetical protein n=1 Tax=Corynebacterium ciconiae TaxID=227319 RepID=UPI00035CC71E|nr:hypothetical protein [Corynebacterium ciconiae]WKD60549.1 hypothetical protein CCICO_02495 [Corynebacterium ciconiae DSM 44920]